MAQFVLSTPVVLWAGWPLLERGVASVVHRSLNMFTLIAMGVSVAWVYSVLRGPLREPHFPFTLRRLP